MKSVITILIILIELSNFCLFAQTSKNDSNFKIYPKDESANDTALFSFIKKIKLIITNKDTSGLYSCLSNDIVVSYGGGLKGKINFINEWNLNRPDSSKFWSIINEILQMGGVFDTDENEKYFKFPYVTSNKLLPKLPNDNYFDPNFTLICLKENIPLYVNANINSNIVAKLSFDIVLVDPDITSKFNTNKANWEWYYVTTVDRKLQGWIQGQNFYSLGGTHLIIRKIKNKYLITHFAGFD